MTEGSLAPRWRDLVRPYATANTQRSLKQLALTGALFVTNTAALIWGLESGVWLAFLLAPPAAAMLVRLFMIQHDCGHGAYFKNEWANHFVGALLGVVTLTPYAFWRDRHAKHHATSGNLDRRGVGDITTLTVREYRALSWSQRFLYRIYRHPLVMFGIGPSYMFLLRHRVPTGHPWRERRTWISVLGTNLVLAAVAITLWQRVGFAPFLLGYGPVFLAAASVGVWLFYVQHQFEHTYWQPQARWTFRAAALQGCSLYDLPSALHWVTCHIGLHHIHHLSSRIPNYRLRECFEAHAEFQRIRRLSFRQSLRCARLALWDEERGLLVPFSALVQRA